VFGAQKPLVVLYSELVSLLDPPQLSAVLAHEAGHVLSDHVMYRTALTILVMLGSVALPIPLNPVKAALLEWSRASELTCDRAAALVTRDPLTVCRSLLSLTAGTAADRLDLDAFMRQASEYRDPTRGFERFTRLFADLNLTHSLPVQRVHELMEWVRSGEYDRIVAGDYLRRDDPQRSPRDEAADAAAHYAQRFRSFFADAGESLATTVEQLGDLLKRD
jgi:Zn-dependent protease with chaperone function